MNSGTVFIALTDPHQPEVSRLIAEADAYAASLYPAESNHLLDLDTLAAPEMRLFSIAIDGKILGCGGYWRHADYGEVKRVYIAPAARGLGLALKLMVHIEDDMRRHACTLARLETGVSQPQALGLYRRLGYVERSAFGDYAPDPLSVFMEKSLIS